METLLVHQAIRPTKFAYLVNRNDNHDLLRAASLSTAVWGGALNPIVPVEPFDAASAVVQEFDPDVPVNLTGRPLPDEISALFDLPALTEDELVEEHWRDGQRFLTLVSIVSLLDDIHQREFRFSTGSSQVSLVKTTDGPPWEAYCAFQFGSFSHLPETDTDYASGILSSTSSKRSDLLTRYADRRATRSDRST